MSFRSHRPVEVLSDEARLRSRRSARIRRADGSGDIYAELLQKVPRPRARATQVPAPRWGRRWEWKECWDRPASTFQSFPSLSVKGRSDRLTKEPEILRMAGSRRPMESVRQVTAAATTREE